MKLSDLFDQLAYGELSQLSMGGREGSGIIQSDYHLIVPHINLGLTEIYKQFPLKQEEVFVQQFDHIQIYYLDSKYAQTNKPEVGVTVVGGATDLIDKYYIMDSVYEPFKDNVLQIERVFNEDGQEYFFNDKNEPYSVLTPSYNSIQIPYPMNENVMNVIYRAAHPKIELKGLNPDTEEIQLPLSHLEALLMYVAARVHSVQPSLEGQNDGNAYYAKFQASIQQLHQLALVNKDATTYDRLHENGWV